MKLLQYFYASVFMGLGVSQALAQNTVLGSNSGTGGYFNTHLGTSAGRFSSANNNSFVGCFSGNNNTTGYDNTFIGFRSGDQNTKGFGNTFLGSSSGFANINGTNNAFLGHNSGEHNTSGIKNTFIGGLSGSSNTDGSYNTFIGFNSGYSNVSGHRNVYLGHHSGYMATSGYDNVYVGHFSGYRNVTGEGNVYLGYLAGYNETGNRKLLVDYGGDDFPLIYGDFNANFISIGTKYTGKDYKLVVPGHVRAVKYDVVSDERLKENIKEITNAAQNLMNVLGASYAMKEGASAQEGSIRQKNAGRARHFGFLAQNIKAIFPELVTEDEGRLAVNYQGMIPVLVEAFKSLAAQKDSIASANALLKEQIMTIDKRLEALEKPAAKKAGLSVFPRSHRLEQNYPNPFSQATTIAYQVSQQTKQVALSITNQQGIEFHRINRLSPGTGQVQIGLGSLKPGIYLYTLFADGAPVQTRQMTVAY